jgi:hypothetical protein
MQSLLRLLKSLMVGRMGQGILTDAESTVELLVLTSSDSLLSKIDFFPPFYKASYLKKVNPTEPSPSVRVPWVLEV